jgi:hypothetical protein
MKIAFLHILFWMHLISSANAQCSILIQMKELGIEGCVLPQVVSTQQFLVPCSVPPGYNQLEVGDFAYIEYIDSACSNICQISPEVAITCLSFPVGIDYSQIADEIKIFPTLVRNRIYIEGNDIYQIELFDDRGVQVMKRKGPDVSVLDVSDFEAGIYFIKVNAKSQILVRKIVKL